MGMSVRFGDFPERFAEFGAARVVILPVPYDGTSTWIKGAKKGPAALLEASVNLEWYDIETDSEVYRRGIYTADPVVGDLEPEELVAVVRKRVDEYLRQEKFVVVAGGEHTVSIGAVEAAAEQWPGLTVLQLDAHADLRQEYRGSRFNHACVMARVREICPIVQVGIRSMDASEKGAVEAGRIFYAKDICGQQGWFEAVMGELGERVYVTIDLDVFDPSVMPSTGTPEPGGLGWYEVIGLLKQVFTRRDVVGFDVVELCPNEQNKSPDFLAAKLVYKLLSYKFEL